jgi:hypothetical protein
MQSKECFFSEIESRNSSPSSQEPNCRVYFKKGTREISVQVHHGMTFSIPLGHCIQNVFPLPEGLLLETFSLKPMDKESLKKEMLDEQTQEMGEASIKKSLCKKFSYFSLNFHPLNQLYCVRLIQEESLGRESISKAIGFTGHSNVFSSDAILSEFVSDAQFINSEVGVFN